MRRKPDNLIHPLDLIIFKKSFFQLLIVVMMIGNAHHFFLPQLTSPKVSFSVDGSRTMKNEKAICHSNEQQTRRATRPLRTLSISVPRPANSFNNIKKLPAVSLRTRVEQSVKSTAMSSNLKMNKNRYQSIILKTAKRYQIEPALINAIIMAESSFNPKAKSPKGAQGLMQLMPRTAKSLGVKDAFNPAHNIEGGTRYFKTLLDRFDRNIELALAAYNAGSRNVRKYDGVPPFKATKIYIKKVLRFYELYKINSNDPESGNMYLTYKL